MSAIGTPDTSSSTPSPNRRAFQRSEVSWTDDLPQCQLSNVGLAANVAYLADGHMTEAYPYEDRAFNFATDYDCYLYGVFDGYDGSRAAHFAAERLPAELLLGQLTPHVNRNSTKHILLQAFSVVERGFFESIDIELAKRTHLQSQLPERIPPEAAEKRYSSILQQIRSLTDSIKGGTTAVVALIVNDNLFVANIGDSRALLCQREKHGRLNVKQITVNHDINNEQELNRLSRLGLNVEKILKRGKLGINECTRCIGDYAVKGGYKENDILKGATAEPVIATPDVFGPIPLSEVEGGFLVLMSDDVYKSLEQATGTQDANGDIASMVSHELMLRNSMEGVSQNVIDKISYLHARGFGKSHTFSRGDITLVVRNINHTLGADALPDIRPLLPDLSVRHPVSVPFKNSTEFSSSNNNFTGALNGKPPVLSLMMPGHAGDSGPQNDHFNHDRPRRGSNSNPPSDSTPTNIVGDNRHDHFTSVRNNDASLQNDDSYYHCNPHEQMELDDENKVTPYVSFANFDEEAWMQMRAAKKGSKTVK